MSRGVVAIAILLASGYVNPARGQSRASVLKWTNLGPEGGGVNFTDLDPQNSSVLYAATGVGCSRATTTGQAGPIVGSSVTVLATWPLTHITPIRSTP
jgi:hypothetical protein